MSRFPSLRARATYVAHTFKAIFRTHHRELIPLLAPYIKDHCVIFDVGAHAGQFAKLFSSMVPRGHVYSFEPGSYALSILRKVKWSLNLRNVTIVPYGLSSQPGQAVLNLPIKNSGSLGFGLASLNTAENPARVFTDAVALTTLDQFFAEHKLNRIDFIKCDIEGWELHMLKGAEKTLRAYRPTVMVEINRAALGKAGTSPEELESYLNTLGYQRAAEIEKDVIFTASAIEK